MPKRRRGFWNGAQKKVGPLPPNRDGNWRGAGFFLRIVTRRANSSWLAEGEPREKNIRLLRDFHLRLIMHKIVERPITVSASAFARTIPSLRVSKRGAAR